MKIKDSLLKYLFGKEVTSYTDQIAKLETELSIINSQLKNKNTENRNLQYLTTEQERQLSLLQNSYEELQTNYKKACDNISRFKKSLDETKVSKDSLVSQFNDLKITCNEWKNKFTLSRDEIASLKDNIEMERKTRTDLQIKLSNLNKSFTDRVKLLEEAHEEISILREQLSQSCDEVSTLKVNLEIEKEVLENLQVRYSNLTNSIKEQEKLLEEAQKEISTLRTSLLSENEIKNNLQEQVRILKESRENSQIEYNQAENYINKLKNNLEQERKANEELINQIDILKKNIKKDQLNNQIPSDSNIITSEKKEIASPKLSLLEILLNDYDSDKPFYQSCGPSSSMGKEESITYLPAINLGCLLPPINLTPAIPLYASLNPTVNPKEQLYHMNCITETVESEDEVSSSEDCEFEDSSLPLVNDYTLVPADKLSIPRVFDVKENKYIEAREFFNRDESELILYRRTLQECITMNKPRFICPECRQPVKISGHKFARGRVCYFAHYKDSDECKYKTGTNRTKEEIERQKYSLVQESLRHKMLKKAIESALKGDKSKEMGVCSVECEKHITGNIPYLNYRRPDVYAEYKGKKLVFELQLSTTFLSVIVERDIFYRLNDINIIWIFNFEDNKEYVNLQNLMCKDIYYANKRNIFIFDEEVKEESQKEGKLILKCKWLDENGIWSTDQKVSLDDLFFDEENNKPYVFDADLKYLEKYPEKALLRKELEHSRSEILSNLLKRQEEERKQMILKADKREKLQKELLDSNLNVSLFQKGTKYGYRYNEEVLISPKYTSAEPLQENGYARVGFNRKTGLVRRDGKEIVPVEYKSIDIIDNVHGVILAYYKDILLCIGEEKYYFGEYSGKEQSILTKEENGQIKYYLNTPQYEYSYSRSFYGDHPICHKYHRGSHQCDLFSILKDHFGCLIWIKDELKYIHHNNVHTLNLNIFSSYKNIKILDTEGLFLMQKENETRWYVINMMGDVISIINYEIIIPSIGEYLFFKVKNNEPINIFGSYNYDYGIINYKGEVTLKPDFSNIFHLKNNLFACQANNLWGIYFGDGRILTQCKFTIIRTSETGEIFVSSHEKFITKWTANANGPTYRIYSDNPYFGLCLLDNKGEISFSEEVKNNYSIRKSSEVFAIFKDRKEIIGYELSSIDFIKEDLAIVKDIFGNIGILKDGKCTIFVNCCDLNFIADNTFILKNEYNDYAFGNMQGQMTKYEFYNIKVLNPSRLIAFREMDRNEYGGHISLYNNDGLRLSMEFDSIREFENGLAEVTLRRKKGFIDLNGVIQERVIQQFGEYSLCDTLGELYIKDSQGNIITEKYDVFESLDSCHFKIKDFNDEWEHIYSLSERRISENEVRNIKVLKEGVFIVDLNDSDEGVNFVSKKVLFGLSPLFHDNVLSEIKLLENNYWAIRDYFDNGWAIATWTGELITEFRFGNILNGYIDRFEVQDSKSNVYFVDLSGQPIEEQIPVPETDLVIYQKMGNYSLLDKNGVNILSSEFSEIKNLSKGLLIIRRGFLWAIFDTNGVSKTDFLYNDISIKSDGKIVATKGKNIGGLAPNGEEIFISEPFNGGYVRTKFGTWDVINFENKQLIPFQSSKIELIDMNGIFSIEKKKYKEKTYVICNIKGQTLDLGFKSVSNIGSGYLIVSQTKPKTIKKKISGHGFKGNPYSRIVNHTVMELKYGLIDQDFNIVLPCKYESISGFDENKNIKVTHNKKNECWSLEKLRKTKLNIIHLERGVEYEGIVVAYSPATIIVQINKTRYSVHKKHLDKKKFSKGDTLKIVYLGYDYLGYPMWEVKH